MDVDPSLPCVLFKGDEESLLAEAVKRFVDAFVGDEDRALLVDEFTIDDLVAEDGGYGMAVVLDALQTPPFLTDRRMVVVRNAGVFSTKDAVAPLVELLAEPEGLNPLVLVWEKDPRPNRAARTSAVPKSLLDAIATVGGVVVDSAPGRKSAEWLVDRLGESSLRFDAAARRLIADHLGEDIGRLPGLLETLTAVFGAGAKVSAPDIEPYLGASGDVAPWDLTDAIDVGDPALAVSVLHRMLDGGGRHPLQVMSTLTTHYLRMVRVDDPTIGNEKAAAAALAIKGSTFPARKALDGARRLGSDRLAGIIDLLAAADLDLRGATAWPPELVMEVLVARLADRNRRSGATSRRR